MFQDVVAKTGDFDRKGSLKSIINFSFMGEISEISIRERAKYRQGDEEKSTQEFYLLIYDSYGWQCSFFRPRMSLEEAQRIQTKIPYGRSISITGECAVRKGNTFFNAKFFRNPDDTDILLVQVDEEPCDIDTQDNNPF